MAVNAKFILTSFGYTLAGEVFKVPDPASDPVVGFSGMGTPIFDNVLLYESDNDALRIDTVMIDLSMQKRIVKTSVNKRRGTIKEFFSEGDWRVILRGAISSNNANVYPIEDASKLKRIVKKDTEIKVVSGMLQQFDIYSLVVEDVRFPEREGVRNVCLFEITCSSDEPYELIEEEKDNA